ncbi:MAG: STAS domain-containing protein [Bryobacteraceae bacterium]
MPFTVARTALESGILVLKLSGRMTLGSQIQSFEWDVARDVEQNRSRIAVDMSEIAYVDSAAIGVLVGCHSTAKNAGGQLRIAAPTDRVRAVFKMTGLENVLNVDASVEESVAALSSAPSAS